MKSVVVFASGYGSTFKYLVEHSDTFQVTHLVTNKPDAHCTEIAKEHSIPVLSTKEEGWINTLKTMNPDLIVLAGYLKMIEPELIKAFPNRIINTHPALLPRYGGKGMYGMNVHKKVVEEGERETGVTVHYVNEEYDRGEIISQEVVSIEASDDAERVSEKVQAVEKPLLLRTVKRLLGGSMKALLSVYDKTDIEKVAEALVKKGYELLSSGGTYRYLKEKGFEVEEVSDYTGSHEMLDGRVKTLHPKIHGGILALRDNKEHMETLKEREIPTIDVVCVNLYPFFQKMKENLSFDELIEFIDIGGPSMLRSAAKNFKSVVVLSDVKEYPEFLERLEKDELTFEYRKYLASEVFTQTTAYDAAIANFLGSEENFLTISAKKKCSLRYGENPHQSAAFYENLQVDGFMKDLTILGGKELSYINMKDIDACYGVVSDFKETCCAAVKHNTPCGVALGETAFDAYKRCYESDPVSIFGGIVAFNVEVDEKTAKELIKTFLEVVIAPNFTEEALAVLRTKKNLRIVEVNHPASDEMYISSVNGGFVVQSQDKAEETELKTVTKLEPTEEQLKDLLFAQKVVKHVKSNAIVVAKDGQTLGIGGGQTNRVDAARYALTRKDSSGAVLASDAFFPFEDTVREAKNHGILAIIQPGGSIRDEESIKACDELGMAMVFTGVRHFKH